MAKKKNAYWIARQADKRLVNSENLGQEGIELTLQAYDEARNILRSEINKVYLNYSNAVGIDVAELTSILQGADRKKFLLSIQDRMRRLGLKVEDVYQPQYIARITRLEALKQQVYWEIMQIAPKEQKISTEKYSEVIEKTYTQISYDTDISMGITPSFATMDKAVLHQILGDRWYGARYSERIWGSVNDVAKAFPMKLASSMMIGSGYSKIYRELRDSIEDGKSSAVRLMQTELNYFHNQAELQYYKDNGYEEYKFIAEMDKRTSDVCKRHNGKKYKVANAQVGENYPPLHPRCRSHTEAVLSSFKELSSKKELPIDKIPDSQFFPTRQIKADVLINAPISSKDNAHYSDVLKWERANQNASLQKISIFNRITGKQRFETSDDFSTNLFLNNREWDMAKGNIVSKNFLKDRELSSIGLKRSDVLDSIRAGVAELRSVGNGQLRSMKFDNLTGRTALDRKNIADKIEERLQKIDALEKKYSEKDIWNHIAERFKFVYNEEDIS